MGLNRETKSLFIREIIKKRYACKSFDPERKISQEDAETIEMLLQKSPSSTNGQPWKFVLATTVEGKKRISKATQGIFSYNEPKVLDASIVIVFASRVDMDEKYLSELLAKEESDERFSEEKFRTFRSEGRATYVNIHRHDYKDLQHWMDKQVYLNLGFLLMGVAAMGLDAVPMEGFSKKTLDKELGLRENDFTSVALVAIGYHDENDYNFSLKKSRLDISNIIEKI